MPEKKRIVILIDNLSVGGAQRQVIEYLKGASHDRFDFHLVNLDATIKTLAPQIEALNIPIHHIEHSGFFNMKTLKTLVKLFRDIQPDLVQTYLFTSDTNGRLAAKLAGRPKVICSIRGMDPWKKKHHFWVDKILLKVTDVVIVNAGNVIPHLKKVWGIHENKVKTIHNGMDISRFDHFRPADEVRAEFGIPADAMVIGMVGRYTFEKDHESMIESMAQLQNQGHDVYFLAMGYGNKHEKLQTMIHEYQLDDRFILTGQRTDAPDLIHAMDICVLASHSEGCPNVILEYMACHKPVVASDVGGCAELVVDGETGFIVPDAAVEQFTDCFRKLLQDASLRTTLGRAGKARLDNEFTTAKLVEKTEALFTELLA